MPPPFECAPVQKLAGAPTLLTGRDRREFLTQQADTKERSVQMTQFPRIEDSAEGLSSRPMRDLRLGALDAVVIREVLTAGEAAVLVDALARNLDDFERTDFPAPFRSHFLGRNLNLQEPDLDRYFAAEPRFRSSFAALGKRIGQDLETELLNRLRELDDVASYRAAPGERAGTRHFFTTAREHRPGGYIPAHFDNEQATRPTYAQIARLTTGDIFSFVLTLSTAEIGGHLELIELRAGAGADGFRADDRLRGGVSLEGMARHPIIVPAGTLVAVASGRLLHRVVPVEGTRSRWTLCSFLATARRDDLVYCWG